MSWREYEVLGAYRESGEPARLQVEAETETDAADFAASKGILISRVVDRTAEREQKVTHKQGRGLHATPARAPTPAPSRPPVIQAPDVPQIEGAPEEFADQDAVAPVDRVRTSSRATPDIQLLTGEHVIETFDAKPSEVGLRGIFFASRRRLTLTNKRLISQERSMISSNLTIVQLSTVDTVRVMPHLWVLQLILGSLVTASSLSLFTLSIVSAISMSALSSSTVLPAGLDASTPLLVSLGTIPLFIGVGLTRSAFRRFVGVDVGGRPVGIYLRRTSGVRLEPFLTAVSNAIAEQQAANSKTPRA